MTALTKLDAWRIGCETLYLEKGGYQLVFLKPVQFISLIDLPMVADALTELCGKLSREIEQACLPPTVDTLRGSLRSLEAASPSGQDQNVPASKRPGEL